VSTPPIALEEWRQAVPFSRVGTPPAPAGLPPTVAVASFFAGVSDQTVAALLWARFADHCTAVVSAPAPPDDNRKRQQVLVRLAQAYALTGDERHAGACLAAIEEWLASPGGAEAAGSDTGFRLISWCWALALLRHADALTPIRMGPIADALRQQAVGLVGHSPSTPATDITVNALALLYVATLFPDFVESDRWRDLAIRILIAECERQVHPDGVHFEQSSCFQRYATDVYLHFVLLAARAGIELPPLVSGRLQRMLEFLVATRMPDGTVPCIGESDGGSLVPLAPRSTADPRGRFAVAAALFGRADFAWAAEGPAPEVAWLMGVDGIRRFDALRPAPPASSPSRAFPSGGYAVMRTGWQRDAHHMLVDIGPIGCPVSGIHGHADLLSIQCSVFGEPVLVDPGTHCYGDSRWRDFFRSTAAHSTIVIDGVSQAEPAESFGWRRQPRVRLRQWHSTADVDFLDAEHDGYASLPQPVHHRRRVIFIKPFDFAQGKPVDSAQGGPAYWIVVDDLNGSGRHDIALTFQFAGINVELGAHPWARAGSSREPCLWISPFPSAPAQPALKCGAAAPICGWISPEYTRLSPAPMLIYRFAVALPWRIVTLLLPDRQGLSTPPGVRPVYDAGGLPHGFVFDRPRRVVRFDDRAVVVERD
jgi:hypothetical protein